MNAILITHNMFWTIDPWNMAFNSDTSQLFSGFMGLWRCGTWGGCVFACHPCNIHIYAWSCISWHWFFKYVYKQIQHLVWISWKQSSLSTTITLHIISQTELQTEQYLAEVAFLICKQYSRGYGRIRERLLLNPNWTLCIQISLAQKWSS